MTYVRFNGNDLAAAMREITLRHANHLRVLGPVRAIALDPCPKCWGRVIASDTQAICTACGWHYIRLTGPEPVASRRADP